MENLEKKHLTVSIVLVIMVAIMSIQRIYRLGVEGLPLLARSILSYIPRAYSRTADKYQLASDLYYFNMRLYRYVSFNEMGRNRY